MVFSNVDITISCCSFVFSQSCAKISSGFTNVSGLAVIALYLILYTAPCLSSSLSLSLTLVSSRRKVLLVCVQPVYCKVVVYVHNAGRGAAKL